MSKYVVTFNQAEAPNVRIWRLSDGKQLVVDDGAIDCLFSPNGSMVATINKPDVQNVRVFRLDKIIDGEAQEIGIIHGAERVIFSPFGDYFAAIKSTGNPRVEIWRKYHDEAYAIHEGAGDAVWESRGDYVATIDTSKHEVIHWKTVGGAGQCYTYKDSVNAVYAPKGWLLATFNGNGLINFWDVMIPGDTGYHGSMKGDELVFSPDGLVAAGIRKSSSPKVQVCRIYEGNCAEILTDNGADSAFFSPDGSLIVTINNANNPNVRIWRVADGEQIIFDSGAVNAKFVNPGAA